jgi:hypothetical protein
MFEAGGGAAVVEDGPATAAAAQIIPDREVVRGFSLPDGDVRWQRSGELFDPGSGLAEENGIVYGTAGASAADTAAASVIEPVFLTALQAATGRSVTLPLPAANTDADVVGAADGLVLVQLSGSMVAFRPVPGPGNSAGPAILDGSSPAAWPGACTLLTTAEISHVLAPGYTAVPVPTLFLAGITWPGPVGCTFIGPAGTDPAVVAKIAWIAPTARQASVLLDSYLAGEQAQGLPAIPIPGGYLASDNTINEDKDCALIPVGRAIVEVTVPNDAAAARALAPIVARNLQGSAADR